jgi:hypothetical protein
MRFRIGIEFCVEADSVDEVDDIQDPKDDGSISGGSLEGLDPDSIAALEAATPDDESRHLHHARGGTRPPGLAPTRT